MKIIWYSTAPYIGVGYGIATREIVHRIQNDGHIVKVATKHHLGGQIIVDGIECFDGGELGLIDLIAEEEGYDYIISFNDAWTFSARAKYYFNKNKWIACVFLDTEFIHPHMIQSLSNSLYQIAITHHSENELKRVGFSPFYAPLGVDTNLFKPDDEIRNKFRQKKGWNDDIFVIGFVGINYPTDRKNIIGLLKAFQRFYSEYPDSILYLHTDVMGSSSEGIPIKWIISSCGFDNEGNGPVKYVNQKDYHLWNISQMELVGLYNAFDVFCFPTCGEGFGLPIIEAQSCGCPVIVTNTTSGKELLKGGWLIPVSDDDYQFSNLLTWNARVPPSSIYGKLKKSYKIWKNGKINYYRNKARLGALEYDWDNVYNLYWRPILEFLENKNKKIFVQDFPNWSDIYKKYSGRILLDNADCGILGCKEICNIDFPKFDGENDPRPILSRSYPIIPTSNGEFFVDSKCKLCKWIGHRFKKETQLLWEELLSYPKIRKQLDKFWDEEKISGLFVPLNSIKIDFEDEYANVFQKIYFTTFKITDEIINYLSPSDKIVDIGCGDGKRVIELREKGFNAIGIEINPFWVDNSIVFHGDIYSLDYPKNYFDVSFCLDVLEHLDNPVLAISEIFRVSKRLVIIEVTSTEDKYLYEDPTHKTFWSVDRWKRELSEYGTILKDLGQAWILEKK